MNQDADSPQEPSAADAPHPDHQPDAAPEGVQVARVNRGWLLKIGAIMIVLVGFGVWGFFDATQAYPERGYRASQALEWAYLQKLAESGQLGNASVEEPVKALADLQNRQTQGVGFSAAEGTRMQWLEALKNTRLLKPEFTKIPRQNPRESVTSATERLAQLKKEWTTANGPVAAPKPLTAYDIPVQWLFVVVGIPFGLYQLWLIIKVLGQKYRFDHATQTLTLTDGTTITPAQLEDVDKRKWHKYMVALVPAAGHPKAGQSIELDLLRHRDLEDWILGMEKTRFPERAAEAEAAASESEEASTPEDPPAQP